MSPLLLPSFFRNKKGLDEVSDRERAVGTSYPLLHTHHVTHATPLRHSKKKNPQLFCFRPSSLSQMRFILIFLFHTFFPPHLRCVFLSLFSFTISPSALQTCETSRHIIITRKGEKNGGRRHERNVCGPSSQQRSHLCPQKKK